MTFMIVPVMYTFHVLAGGLFQWIRMYTIHGGLAAHHQAIDYETVSQDLHDEFHIEHGGKLLMKKYEEEVVEAMNDVASLCISFLFVQALRYNISGVLPNNMGIEPEDYVHGAVSSWQMLGAIVLLCGGTAMTVILQSWVPKQDQDTWINRAFIVLQTSLAMAMAWSLLCLTKWELARNMSLFGMKGGSPNTIKSKIMTAVGLSTVSFMVINFLDKLADASWTGDQTDAAIERIIEALGILVGFSWEQAFDGGAEDLSVICPGNTVLVKLALACVVGAMVVTPWRRHILQTVMRLEEERGGASEDNDLDLEEDGLRGTMFEGDTTTQAFEPFDLGGDGGTGDAAGSRASRRTSGQSRQSRGLLAVEDSEEDDRKPWSVFGFLTKQCCSVSKYGAGGFKRPPFPRRPTSARDLSGRRAPGLPTYPQVVRPR